MLRVASILYEKCKWCVTAYNIHNNGYYIFLSFMSKYAIKYKKYCKFLLLITGYLVW